MGNRNDDSAKWLSEGIEELYICIANTRYSRIRAEERVNRVSKLVILLNVWFSSWIIVLSGFAAYEGNEAFGTLSLIMSVFLLGFIVYYSCQHYSERALKFRQNYINLEVLQKLLKKKQELSISEFNKIKEEFFSLLGECENHCMFDYYNAAHIHSFTHNSFREWSKISDKESKKIDIDDRVLKYTSEMKYRRFWGWLWRISVSVFLISIPFIMLIGNQMS